MIKLLLTKYKKFFIGVALTALLVISANIYIGSVERASFKKGYEEANTAWMVKGKEYVSMIDDEKAKNTALNYTLTLLSEGKLIEEQKRQSAIIKQQQEYLQRPESKKHSFDDHFIKLYNDSLGE